jgi:surface protein
MFSFCSSLKKIPDISLWNIDNVSQMNFMFFKCESLSSLPDLSKWNISKVENTFCMFSKCPLLSSLPKFNFNESDVNSESNETKKAINELLKKILDDN